ncbi:hypothetical protein GSY71_01215 [Pusillimonas sp. TS35]|nr:hypothetical protein [Pusillimonas sp. TS35]
MANENLTIDVRVSMADLERKAWAISNVLQTLYAALPDDAADSAVPTRCLISTLFDMAEELATNLGDFESTHRIAIKGA